jgi:hypothetical protein
MCVITGTSGVVLSPPPFVFGSLPFVVRPTPVLFRPLPFVVCSAGVVLRPAPVFVRPPPFFLSSFPCVLRSSRFVFSATSFVLSATLFVVVVSVAHQFSSRVPVVDGPLSDVSGSRCDHLRALPPVAVGSVEPLLGWGGEQLLDGGHSWLT